MYKHVEKVRQKVRKKLIPFYISWEFQIILEILRQFCADTGCSLEDLPGAMYDKDGCRKRAKSAFSNRLYDDGNDDDDDDTLYN